MGNARRIPATIQGPYRLPNFLSLAVRNPYTYVPIQSESACRHHHRGDAKILRHGPQARGHRGRRPCGPAEPAHPPGRGRHPKVAPVPIGAGG